MINLIEHYFKIENVFIPEEILFYKFILSQLYDHGIGVEEDSIKAFHYCMELWEGYIGFYYQDEKKQVDAIRHYKLAAEQGDCFAQTNLAMCYEAGNGVEKDMNEAYRLYKLAVEQGILLHKAILRLVINMAKVLKKMKKRHFVCISFQLNKVVLVDNTI